MTTGACDAAIARLSAAGMERLGLSTNVRCRSGRLAAKSSIALRVPSVDCPSAMTTSTLWEGKVWAPMAVNSPPMVPSSL
ncbi:MAG: hypothetical protein A2V88_03645 [Elusimicrobia bacterium RBG_16_66_12]|nr:MAG: hypothetical protein A2V88_03645 [Elusimicrobia bacterium RBG_16_66_12]